MNKIDFITENELFDFARDAAKGFTQQEIADQLGCSQPAVAKMMKGESKMVSLAVRWIEMRSSELGWVIESEDGRPVHFFKKLPIST